MILYLVCLFYVFNGHFIGIEPPKDKKIWLDRKPKLTEEELNEPVDRPFQYVGMSKSIRKKLTFLKIAFEFLKFILFFL